MEGSIHPQVWGGGLHEDHLGSWMDEEYDAEYDEEYDEEYDGPVPFDDWEPEEVAQLVEALGQVLRRSCLVVGERGRGWLRGTVRGKFGVGLGLW